MKRSRFGQSQCTPLPAVPDSLTGYSQHFLDTYTSVKMHQDTYPCPSPISDVVADSAAVFAEPHIAHNIKYLAIGKAPGEDGIIAELLKPILICCLFLFFFSNVVTF
jgi:hypothetical protein